MELTGYLAVARRWWWTLLVATWVAAMAGLLVASRITPTYEAQVQLLVGPINTDSDTLRASGLLVQTYAQLAISPPLLKSTAQEVGGVDPIKLGQAVRATANDTTRVLAIRVQDASPDKAAQIANTMADELIQLTTGATTRPEGQLEVIGAAVPNLTPVAPQVSLIVLLAMAAGLIGGLVLVIIVEYATDTVRDRSDLARLSGKDVLATISSDARQPGVSPLPIAEATAPNSPNAVAYRLLASKVAFAETDLPTRTIMVASVGDGDSAVVATAIAAAVAGSGHRAVVIDGSSDRDITDSLGLGGLVGLRDVTQRGATNPSDALVGGPAGIRILPRGGPGAAELIAVDRAREILESLLRDADLIVVDGGAMQRSAGALSWARAAEQTILVVRRGTSRREDLLLGMESLRFVNASIGGTVLVQRAPGRGFGRRSKAARGSAPESRPATFAAATPTAAGRPMASISPVAAATATPMPSATPFVPSPSNVLPSRWAPEIRPVEPVRHPIDEILRPVEDVRAEDQAVDDADEEPTPAPTLVRPPSTPTVVRTASSRSARSRANDSGDGDGGASPRGLKNRDDFDETRPVRKTTPRTRRAD